MPYAINDQINQSPETSPMNTSQEIMESLYRAEDGGEYNERYQKDKGLYATLADALNYPVKDNPEKLTHLITMAKSIFWKRNQVQTDCDPERYRYFQERTIPVLIRQYESDLAEFLKSVNVHCPPEDFDHAVLSKMDIYTQKMLGNQDPRYLDLKNLFLPEDNCSTPLDLLFHGMFVAREKRKKGKSFLVLIVAILIMAVFFYFLITSG